jgi:adenylate cyclase
MPTDYESEGLLEGLDPQARAARIELLRELEHRGVPLEELRRATREGRLTLLLVEQALEGEGPRYTNREIAELSGLSEELLARLWRALGMALADPDERVYTAADLEAAKRVRKFGEAGLDDERIIDLSRVASRAMSSVAAAMGAEFARAFLRPGDNERDLALRYAEASRVLLPMLGPTIEHILGVQQRALTRQAAVNATALQSGSIPGAQEVTVGFADLVGFTKLGETLSAAELGAVAKRFEEMAADLAHPPVRLVKTIGDAAMLESADTDALLAAELALVAAADEEGEGFPLLKAGVARGEAIARAGDFFGRPVNLASRVTAIARPGSVLADEAAKEDATDSYTWSSAGRRRLKGVDGQVRLWRVRRPAADATPE